MKTHRIIFTLVTILVSTQLFAQKLESAIKAETLPSPQKPEGRQSVALVLAGGGARGFAHIPVLELLEEERIPIDIIIGNSAGSIVAGLYAAGYTPQEILDTMEEFTDGAVLKDETYSPFEQTLGNHSTLNSPVRINFGEVVSNRQISLGLGNGLISGQNVYELFKKLTIRIPSDIDFDALPIPFRAVAVDLIDAEIKIFDSGDVAEAIRSSMSIPGIFQSFEVDGHHYIDGMALDDTPLDVAVKMGYDIVIVSFLSDGLKNDSEQFNASPLAAVMQMANMEQAIRLNNNESFITLAIHPDYADQSMFAYARGKKIYNASKESMERYRDACKTLRERIFAQDEQTTTISSAITSRTMNTQDAPNSDLAISSEAVQTQSPFPQKKYAAVYAENTPLRASHINVQNAVGKDEAFIEDLFAKLKDKDFTEDDFTNFSDAIFRTGRYRTVVMRITGNEGDMTLDVILGPQQKEYGVLLLGTNLMGTLAMDSTIALSLVADIQWRGLLGYGSILSAKVSVFNGFGAELMWRQPLTSRIFSELSVAFDRRAYGRFAGWRYYPSSLFYMQDAKALLQFGITPTRRQVVLTGTSFNWFDTREAIEEGDYSFAGDFFGEYTINTLDSTCFPTSGVYLSARGTGVLPLRNENVSLFNVTEFNVIAAIPVGGTFNIVLDGFFGTDFSERLDEVPTLLPVYGFSLADRRFFPQIVSRAMWGMHKAAASATVQFSPKSDLTIFGMRLMFFVSGAVGNIWNRYADISFSDLQWRSSVDAGIRIQDNYGILLRIGAGTTRDVVRPFISLDMGNIRF